MVMLVNCSNCHTHLQLPPGATSIRCAVCKAITRIADPPPLPPPYLPSNSSSYNNVNYNHYHPPPPPPPPAHGRKKAVIVGISYRNTRNELKGCINDAKCMKCMFVNRFKFPESSILLLTDEATDAYRIPTKRNIMWVMFWLVQGCEPGDSLVFHYSGHGSQQQNDTGDEIDGFDETLCPLDYETQGMIVDDDINATLVRPLPAGVKLHAIIDACNSGTVLDLLFLCRMDRNGWYRWEDHRPLSGTLKDTDGGEAISFCGCDDDQTSTDTDALSKGTSTGTMTFAFIQAIEKGQGTTYGNILNAMRSTTQNTVDHLVADGAARIGLRQEPQLSSNLPFDVYAKPFSL